MYKYIIWLKQITFECSTNKLNCNFGFTVRLPSHYIEIKMAVYNT